MFVKDEIKIEKDCLFDGNFKEEKVKEEPIETDSLSENGGSHENCLEQNQDELLQSIKLESMHTYSEEDTEEINPSFIYIKYDADHLELVAGEEKPIVNLIKDENVIMDQISETGETESEYEIDIKSEIDGKEQKYEYISIKGKKIADEINSSSPTTDLKMVNGTRKESTITTNEKINTGCSPFSCKLCQKSYTSKYGLIRHEKIHSEEKPFQCNFCSKFFYRRGYWLQHERIHTGETPFLCKLCLKSFTSKSALMRHKKFHTEGKQFHCTFCSKSFYLKRLVLQHERIHTGDSPFWCELCSKSFISNTNLMRHDKLHTGENLFECEFCLNFLASKQSLIQHERVHTGETPFQCKLCSKSFISNYSLLRHTRENHSNVNSV